MRSVAQVDLFIASLGDWTYFRASAFFLMQTYDGLSVSSNVSGSSQAGPQSDNHGNSNAPASPRLSRRGLQASEVSFLGLRLHPMSQQELTDTVEQGILEDRRWIITNHNLHSLYLLHRLPKLQEFYKNAHWTFIDGMSLIALSNLYGYALERKQRVTLADWMYPLMETAAHRAWRVFHLGSPDGVAEEGAKELRKLYPGLQIEVESGYFNASQGSAENETVVQRINAYAPDLLMVGMSMPRQEFWTQENSARLNARVILASNGAAIEYIAGAVPTPPRWAGRVGLEWAFRLKNEPRRLFGRYLVEPWYLLLLLARDFVRKGGRLSERRPEKVLGQTLSEGL
jgi:N-acetylglucosaminyldiphosphoundecaprenol N-acetyl-beta-D-mannosaminyltransferase